MVSKIKKIDYRGNEQSISNCSVRFEPGGNIELIIYDRSFSVDSSLYNSIDRSRLLQKNSDGFYEVVRDDFSISKLRRSIRNSTKRSLQKFYDYGLANKWEYFITLTFSDQYVNRYDVDECKYKLSLFTQFLRDNNPSPKYLLVPEPHKKLNSIGQYALHFHGFLADVPNLIISPAFNDGVIIPDVYVLNDWKFGFSTVKLIPNDNNSYRVLNYCMKYLSKSDNVEYNQKRFYHSRNLSCCYSEVGFIDDIEKMNIISEFRLTPVKIRDGYTVYRNSTKI